MHTFKAHSKPIYNLAFAPDGRHLLSSGGDEKVILWSLDTYKREQEWPGSQFIAPIAFSPDGHYIGIGGYSIRMWQVGKTQTPVVDSKEYATSCCFSPAGSVFAAFGAERAIMRWAVPDGTPLSGGWGGTRASNGNIRFPTGGMAYHPEGRIIANCYGILEGCGYDSVIHLWDAESGALINTLKMDYRYAHPTRLVFSPDGERLVADTGPILHVWDIRQGKEIATLQVGKKHFKEFTFTGNGRTLLAVNGEHEVYIWDTVNWNEMKQKLFEIGKLTAIAVYDNKKLAVGNSSGKVMVFQLPAECPLMTQESGHDPALAQQMEAAERVMRSDHNALRMLTE